MAEALHMVYVSLCVCLVLSPVCVCGEALVVCVEKAYVCER